MLSADPGTEPLLEVRDLRVRYPDVASEALRGVSLALRAGEILLLTGASGCGKSTLLQCLRGVVPGIFDAEVRGDILFAGEPISERGVAALSDRIGLVLQEPAAQLCNLTVETEVAFGVENLLLPADVCRERTRQALEAVSLIDKAKDSVDALSGGECQRLAIASVLAMQPTVLLLDEPTSTLDSAAAAEIVALVRELAASGHGIIVVQHDFEELLPYAHRMVVLDEGVVAFEGTPRSVVAQLAAQADRVVAIPAVSAIAQLVGISMDADSVPVTPEELVLRLGSAGDGPSAHDHDREPLPAPDDGYLVARGLSFSYPRAPRAAVSSLNLTLAKGETIALVGRNGSGKSTLARLLAGLLTPRKGTITVAGKRVEKLKHRSTVRDTGYVFQFPEHQFVTSSVQAEIAYGLECQGVERSIIDAAVLDTAERLQLADKLERHPFTLSGGEKRRLSVATMLVLTPALLVLDEPTYGLDEANLDSLVSLLFTQLRAVGTTIVVITHDMSLVAEHVDHVIAMSDSQAVFQGSATEFFDSGVMDLLGLIPPPAIRAKSLLRDRGWGITPSALTVPQLGSAINEMAARWTA